MKAKDLAKFLMQHPNAEVVAEIYLGDTGIIGIEHAKLYTKGSAIESVNRTYSDVITNNGKCKVDVIYIGHEDR